MQALGQGGCGGSRASHQQQQCVAHGLCCCIVCGLTVGLLLTVCNSTACTINGRAPRCCQRTEQRDKVPALGVTLPRAGLPARGLLLPHMCAKGPENVTKHAVVLPRPDQQQLASTCHSRRAPSITPSSVTWTTCPRRRTCCRRRTCRCRCLRHCGQLPTGRATRSHPSRCRHPSAWPRPTECAMQRPCPLLWCLEDGWLLVCPFLHARSQHGMSRLPCEATRSSWHRARPARMSWHPCRRNMLALALSSQWKAESGVWCCRTRRWGLLWLCAHLARRQRRPGAAAVRRLAGAPGQRNTTRADGMHVALLLLSRTAEMADGSFIDCTDHRAQRLQAAAVRGPPRRRLARRACCRRRRWPALPPAGRQRAPHEHAAARDRACSQPC